VHWTSDCAQGSSNWRRRQRTSGHGRQRLRLVNTKPCACSHVPRMTSNAQSIEVDARSDTDSYSLSETDENVFEKFWHTPLIFSSRVYCFDQCQALWRSRLMARATPKRRKAANWYQIEHPLGGVPLLLGASLSLRRLFNVQFVRIEKKTAEWKATKALRKRFRLSSTNLCRPSRSRAKS
jgi:hypothetical protein